MSIEIALATSNKEKEHAFAVRYQVFAKEGGWIPKNSSELEYDEYDLSENTFQFVAYDGDTPIGTTRLILFDSSRAHEKHTSYGLRVEKDFTILSEGPFLADGLAEMSRSAVLKEYRSKNILAGIYSKIVEYAYDIGIEQIVAGVNPSTDNLKEAKVMYDLGSLLSYCSSDIHMIPLHSSQENTSVSTFYDNFSQESFSCDDIELTNTSLPPVPRMLVSKFSFKFCGNPVYDNTVNMCSLPMSWSMKEAKENKLLRHLDASLPPLKNYIKKDYLVPLAS